MNRLLLALLGLAGCVTLSGTDHSVITWEKIKLDDTFYAEGATYGDIDGDGHHDLVAGPYWYPGPDYDRRNAFYPPKPFDTMGYSDNFFPHVVDLNADGRSDILVIGFPGETATWYENTGAYDAHWPAHVVFEGVDNESPAWTDLTGDGRPELVCIYQGRYGYAEPDWSDPTAPWTFTPITPDGGWQKFTHGMGLGDVDGDGRLDLLERTGWWEQPASLDGDPLWTKHDVAFADPGGAQMFAFDIDADGDNDVITSRYAHGHGLLWYEQVDRDGAIAFEPHVIMDARPEDNPYGVAFGELHALELVDIDGDGVRDILTGKRWWSHKFDPDPDPNPKPYLYWFRLVRDDAGGVEFVPHLIDDDTGVGVQVTAGDIDRDGLPDVLVSNKLGTTVLFQRREQVGEDAWREAQPRPVAAGG